MAEDYAEQQEKDEPQYMDPGIEDEVYLGLKCIKEDAKRQGQGIERLQKGVLSMKTEVAKTTALPVEVHKVGNDITRLVENVNTFGTNFIKLKANMLGVMHDIQGRYAVCLRSPAMLSRETRLR